MKNKTALVWEKCNLYKNNNIRTLFYFPVTSIFQSPPIETLADIPQNNYLTQMHIHYKCFKMYIYGCQSNNVTLATMQICQKSLNFANFIGIFIPNMYFSYFF